MTIKEENTTVFNKKTRDHHYFKVGKTLEYFPLNNRAGTVIAYYKQSDIKKFNKRFNRKHPWNLHPDLDNMTMIVSVKHADLDTPPSITIPLYRETPEMVAALEDLKVAYKKEQEEIENEENQKIIYQSLAGKFEVDHFRTFADYVYEGLRGYKNKRHTLRIETAVSPDLPPVASYFPTVQLWEIANLYRPTRNTDPNEVFNMSIIVKNITREWVGVDSSKDMDNYIYRDRTVDPYPVLIVETTGSVKIRSQIIGTFERPDPNDWSPQNKLINFDLSQLTIKTTPEIDAIVNVITLITTQPASQETAVSPVNDPKRMSRHDLDRLAAELSHDDPLDRLAAKLAHDVGLTAEPANKIEPVTVETAVIEPEPTKKPKRSRKAKKPAWTPRKNRLSRENFVNMLNGSYTGNRPYAAQIIAA